MKPEWCEKLADEAAEAYHKWLHGTRLKHSTPELSRFIARSLLDAHQRGKDEKEREVADLLKNSAAVRVNYLRGRIACQPLIDEAVQRGRREGRSELMEELWPSKQG